MNCKKVEKQYFFALECINLIFERGLCYDHMVRGDVR